MQIFAQNLRSQTRSTTGTWKFCVSAGTSFPVCKFSLSCVQNCIQKNNRFRKGATLAYEPPPPIRTVATNEILRAEFAELENTQSGGHRCPSVEANSSGEDQRIRTQRSQPSPQRSLSRQLLPFADFEICRSAALLVHLEQLGVPCPREEEWR